jgi:hypothetical protein
MSLFQAEKLIDLACSTTHEEEARTAALTACRMIRKLGFQLTAGDARRVRTPRAAAKAPTREKPPNGGTFAKATHWRRCDNCGDSIAAGDTVYIVDNATWCERH